MTPRRFQVTTDAQRPASEEAGLLGKCFYCRQPIGDYHEEDCVLVHKKAKIRMIVEYDIEVPSTWTAEDIEFQRNESSYCASNAISELEALDSQEETCLCEYTKFECIDPEVSEHYLDEK